MKTYEGFRQKRKADLEMSKKFKDFAPQEYVIFLYNDELIFGQITNHKMYKDSEVYGEDKYSYYLIIDIFDVLTDNGNSWYKPDKNWEFGLENRFNLLFKTTSKLQAEKEYERIKTVEPYSDWELNRVAKQYNL